jgi:hypothetical protein
VARRPRVGTACFALIGTFPVIRFVLIHISQVANSTEFAFGGGNKTARWRFATLNRGETSSRDEARNDVRCAAPEHDACRSNRRSGNHAIQRGAQTSPWASANGTRLTSGSVWGYPASTLPVWPSPQALQAFAITSDREPVREPRRGSPRLASGISVHLGGVISPPCNKGVLGISQLPVDILLEAVELRSAHVLHGAKRVIQPRSPSFSG